MIVDIDALYKRQPVILWVEDTETKTWLDAVWRGKPTAVGLLVAGGRRSVESVCHQAYSVRSDDGDRPYGHVFGLVDRDFGRSNRRRWGELQQHERVYRLDVHEVENLLIDPDALAGCRLNTRRRSRDEIEAVLRREAEERLWWVACARFLQETGGSARAGYPAVPRDPAAVSSLEHAKAFITGSAWFSTTAAGCPALATPGAVEEGLNQAHEHARAALDDGSWRGEFPGKPLFRRVSDYIQRAPEHRWPHRDLALAVGEWQRRSGLVPDQAGELRRCILARCGVSEAREP